MLLFKGLQAYFSVENMNYWLKAIGLSRNLHQSMFKNVYFFGKNCKNRLSVRGSDPIFLRRIDAPPPHPRIVTHAYHFNLSAFVSNAKEKNSCTYE